MNIANEYAEPEVGGTGFFRDTHVKIEGPAVASLAR
jgi:phosphatidylserine/phosphatidylglycerophosphate/cardiolipin synthase-like enzyme